jgi:hypothetical protein
VCKGRDNLIPYGVDKNKRVIQHAHLLLPQFWRNFVVGDIFEPQSWHSETRRYSLALLMLGRLTEVPAEQARHLMEDLQSMCSRILVYVYPDWAMEPIEVMARRFDLQLERSQCDGAGFLTGGAAAKESIRRRI